ncbi:MAG: GNAT family N-acetyltransferase [Candidatus Binatia bacterium]
MTLEFRYAGTDEYGKISRFLDEHWAKDHVYVRSPRLFEWTFARTDLLEHDGYSVILAEDKGRLIGILGTIPFRFNLLGRSLRGAWLANYVVRAEYRRGPAALQLLGVLRQSPYNTTIAFGVNPGIAAIYRVLRWHVLEEIPRNVIVLPKAEGRMTALLRLANPDWSIDRATVVARRFTITEVPSISARAYDTLPADWDDHWAQFATRTVGAARDHHYLSWRYLHHPVFSYRFIVIPDGEHAGLAVWRLETILRATPQGRTEIDRFGRLVEFLPTSRRNAEALLVRFLCELTEADAVGADYYGFHGEMRMWLEEFGFCGVANHPDGHRIPSRFQPLDDKGGRILSAVFARDGAPPCSIEPHCVWYWTKSDADQDRPN